MASERARASALPNEPEAQSRPPRLARLNEPQRRRTNDPEPGCSTDHRPIALTLAHAGLTTGAHERTHGRRHPNEPEPHRGTARPRQRARPRCRGHGFLRSHGPHEQKVNGEWLMSRYRRPKIGGIEAAF